MAVTINSPYHTRIFDESNGTATFASVNHVDVSKFPCHMQYNELIKDGKIRHDATAQPFKIKGHFVNVWHIRSAFLYKSNSSDSSADHFQFSDVKR